MGRGATLIIPLPLIGWGLLSILLLSFGTLLSMKLPNTGAAAKAQRPEAAKLTLARDFDCVASITPK